MNIKTITLTSLSIKSKRVSHLTSKFRFEIRMNFMEACSAHLCIKIKLKILCIIAGPKQHAVNVKTSRPANNLGLPLGETLTSLMSWMCNVCASVARCL